jgi:Domain of unknown function (DUF1707)/Domain of unknown function (DUF4190)
MPSTARRPHDLRASDAEREATVDRLRIAATEGRLEPEELEERLTSVYAARWRSELEALTADVTPPPPARPPRPLFAMRPRRTTNRLAVLSLVCALIFVWWFDAAGAIAAIVLGHMAIYRIARSNGTQRGRAWASLGLMLGYVELLVFALWSVARFIPGPG